MESTAVSILQIAHEVVLPTMHSGPTSSRIPLRGTARPPPLAALWTAPRPILLGARWPTWRCCGGSPCRSELCSRVSGPSAIPSWQSLYFLPPRHNGICSCSLRTSHHQPSRCARASRNGGLPRQRQPRHSLGQRDARPCVAAYPTGHPCRGSSPSARAARTLPSASC